MRFIPLLFVFAHLACSTNYLVSDATTGEDVVSLQELNLALREQEATIEFMDGSTTVARQVEIGADTVTWFGLRGGPRQSAGRGKVQSIVIREIGRGVLEGLGIGAGIGATVGLLTAAIAVGEPHELEGLAYIFLPGLGIGTGILIGSIYGSIQGHEHRYELQLKEPREESDRSIPIEPSSLSLDVVHLSDGSSYHGMIVEVIFEKYGTGTTIRYVKNGVLHRDVIAAEMKKGNRLKTVIIEVEGVRRTFDAEEIARLEKTE